MGNIQTVRRDKLLRDIKKGLYVGKCSGRYTDDYAWDAATNFGETEILEINIKDKGQAAKAGALNIREEEFRGRSGGAYRDEERFCVHFYPHGGKDYELVLKSDLKAYREAKRAREEENLRIRDGFDRAAKDVAARLGSNK